MPLNALRHMVETNLDALRRIGIQPSVDERRMTLVPGVAAEAVVARHLAGFGLGGGDFIHIHPASRWFSSAGLLSTWQPWLKSCRLMGMRSF
jgi:heptosyltransferase-3